MHSILNFIFCRFLGTLRDMGNEQHRFFLHAVAMIGGEPLRNVDMEAYMCAEQSSLYAPGGLDGWCKPLAVFVHAIHTAHVNVQHRYWTPSPLLCICSKNTHAVVAIRSCCQANSSPRRTEAGVRQAHSRIVGAGGAQCCSCGKTCCRRMPWFASVLFGRSQHDLCTVAMTTGAR